MNRDTLRYMMRYRMLPERYVVHVTDYIPDEVEVAGLTLFVVRYNPDGNHIMYHDVITNDMINAITSHVHATEYVDDLGTKIVKQIKEIEDAPVRSHL